MKIEITFRKWPIIILCWYIFAGIYIRMMHASYIMENDYYYMTYKDIRFGYCAIVMDWIFSPITIPWSWAGKLLSGY